MPVQLLTEEEYTNLKNYKESFYKLLDTILLGENKPPEVQLLYMENLIIFSKALKTFI